MVGIMSRLAVVGRSYRWKRVNAIPAEFHEILGSMSEEEFAEGFPPLRDLLSLDREPSTHGWATVLEDRGEEYGKCPWGVFVVEWPEKNRVIRQIARETGIRFKN